MHRIDADAHVGNAFSDGDPGIGQPGTRVDADWLNAVQEEIANAITAKGIALVKGTNNQLATALAAATAAIPPAGTWTADTATGQEPLAWRDGSGIVHCRGRIISASGLASGSTIATLPAGFRPAAKRSAMLAGYAAAGAWVEAYAVEVNSDGTLVPRQLAGNSAPVPSGAGDRFDLSGISFLAGG